MKFYPMKMCCVVWFQAPIHVLFRWLNKNKLIWQINCHSDLELMDAGALLPGRKQVFEDKPGEFIRCLTVASFPSYSLINLEPQARSWRMKCLILKYLLSKLISSLIRRVPGHVYLLTPQKCWHCWTWWNSHIPPNAHLFKLVIFPPPPSSNRMDSLSSPLKRKNEERRTKPRKRTSVTRWTNLRRRRGNGCREVRNEIKPQCTIHLQNTCRFFEGFSLCYIIIFPAYRNLDFSFWCILNIFMSLNLQWKMNLNLFYTSLVLIFTVKIFHKVLMRPKLIYFCGDGSWNISINTSASFTSPAPGASFINIAYSQKAAGKEHVLLLHPEFGIHM